MVDTRPLPQIINDKFSGRNNPKPVPTIVNPASKFVVSTYWWGGDNLNKNTARPCQSYFESLLHRFVEVCVDILASREKSEGITYASVSLAIKESREFKKLLARETKIYYNQMADHFNIPIEQRKAKDSDTEPLQSLIPLLQSEIEKSVTKPEGYVFPQFDDTQNFISKMLLESLSIILDLLFELTKITVEVNQLKTENRVKKQLINILKENTPESRKEIKELKKQYSDEKIKEIYGKEFMPLIINADQEKRQITARINAVLNKSRIYSNEELATMFNDKNLSIYNALHTHMRFLHPLSYREMIAGWERSCAAMNCNYLAVEFPEFAVKGGYQLAINAKPLFIQAALKCVKDNTVEGEEARSIVYIDGDMYMRKYPHLFDMPDIDYMARGWWMDPRSSNFMNAVTYDPYLFETSGGIMYFSQSYESNQLINFWVTISEKAYQQGKADDRLISLIFNTKKLLLPLKIMQIPIEFLWLTLDYNDRLLDTPIYWKQTKDTSEPEPFEKMMQSIIVEHPECLTTEDTASSSGGASSDRTPKFYNYLEEEIDPVSEEFHEYLMFPNKEMLGDFKDYLDFMKRLPYINNDWQEVLLRRKWIRYSEEEDPYENWEQSEDNVKPLNIIPYDEKYGDEGNDIVAENEGYIKSVNMSEYPGNEIILPFSEDVLPIIIRLLQEGKTVIYNPTTQEGYNREYLDEYMTNKSKYERIELVFVPDLDNTKSPHFIMVPKIQLNQVMVFKPSHFMIKYLKMFYKLQDFANKIESGSYEFVSRVRIAYLILTKGKTFKGQITTGKARIMKPIEEVANPPIKLPAPLPEVPSYSEMVKASSGRKVGGGSLHPHVQSHMNAIKQMYEKKHHNKTRKSKGGMNKKKGKKTQRRS